MKKSDKIYLAGHTGMVGSATLEKLHQYGYKNIIVKTHNEMDLLNQNKVNEFIEFERPEIVIIAAAKVGGIKDNNEYPADYLYINLMINANIIKASHDYGVKKLLVLGSSCIYPKDTVQPIKEEVFLSGELESTNEGYSVAKIAAIELCKFYKRQYNDNFISCMPTNIYGPNDNFDLNSAHVIPSLIRKFHEAKVNGRDAIVLWGSGKPQREFMYVDDMAAACICLLERYDEEYCINVGTGEEISIFELAHIIRDVIGFKGKLVFDTSKPDGMARRVLDCSRIHDLGWCHKVNLQKGIEKTYQWYLENVEKGSKEDE